MFAIVRLGNQQFKVKVGDFIRAPFQDKVVKDKIEIPVLAFNGEKGFAFDTSKLGKAKVKAVVVRQSLGKKIIVFKKKRRKGYRRTKGHRQKITELKILELCSPEGKVIRVEWKGESGEAAPVKSLAQKTSAKKSKEAPVVAQKAHKKTSKPVKTQKTKSKATVVKALAKKESNKKTKSKATDSVKTQKKTKKPSKK